MRKILTILSFACLSVVGFGQGKAVSGRITSTQFRDLETRLKALESGKVNPTPDSAVLLFDYEFTEDSIDQTSYRRDFTPSSAFLYDDLDTEGGFWWGDFNGSTKSADIEITDVTQVFTVMLDVKNGTENESRRTLIGGDGWEFRMDPTIGRLIFVTWDGPTVDSIYTDPGVFTVDPVYPYGRFRAGASTDNGGYIIYNGEILSVSGDILLGFRTSSEIRMGQSLAGSNYCYCWEDNVRLWMGPLTAEFYEDEYESNPYFNPDINLPPIPLSAIVNNGDPTIIAWSWNDNFQITNDSLDNAVTVTLNDSIVTVDSVVIADGVLNVRIPAVAPLDRVRVSYNSAYYSGLHNLLGVAAASYNDYIVINNVLADSTDVADIIWGMNGTNEDDANNYDAVDTAMLYSTDAISGSHAGNFVNATRKWWLPPGYNNNAMPDTFSIAFWYRPTIENTGMTAYSNERYGTTGEGIWIYFNVNGLDYYMVAETGNSGARVEAKNSFTLDAYQFFVATYWSGSGVGKLYVDGVDETDIGFETADANVTLTGPWRLGHLLAGVVDEPMIFNRALTDEEVAWMFDNPGESPKEPGAGSVPDLPPIPPDPPPTYTVYTSYADSLYMNTFEDSELGPYTVADVRAEWINPEKITSDIASWAEIIDVPAVANGEATRALKISYPTDTYAAQHVSADFIAQIPYDPQNKKTKVGFDVIFKPGMKIAGGNKIPGWIAGFHRLSYLGAENGARRNTTPPFHLEGAESATTMKELDGSSDLLVNPYLWWGSNELSGAHSSPRWFDPDNTSAPLAVDVGTDSLWHRIDWIIDLGDENQDNGYVEGMYGCKLAFQKTEMLMRDRGIVVDAIKVYLMWGGGEDKASERPEWIIIDNIGADRYRTDYSGYRSGPSEAGRIIRIPYGERLEDGSYYKNQ